MPNFTILMVNIGYIMDKFYNKQEKETLLSEYLTKHTIDSDNFLDIARAKFSNEVFRGLLEMDQDTINLMFNIIYGN